VNTLRVRPAARALAGRVRPPGDKSISHRSAILGGLAEGTTEIEGDHRDVRRRLQREECHPQQHLVAALVAQPVLQCHAGPIPFVPVFRGSSHRPIEPSHSALILP